MSLAAERMKGHSPVLRLKTAAFYGRWGFTCIDPNLIMILLVLFSLGTFRRLVTWKTEGRAKEMK